MCIKIIDTTAEAIIEHGSEIIIFPEDSLTHAKSSSQYQSQRTINLNIDVCPICFIKAVVIHVLLNGLALSAVFY